MANVSGIPLLTFIDLMRAGNYDRDFTFPIKKERLGSKTYQHFAVPFEAGVTMLWPMRQEGYTGEENKNNPATIVYHDGTILF